MNNDISTENNKKSRSVAAFVLGIVSLISSNLMSGVLAAILGVIATLLQIIPIVGQIVGVVLTVPVALLQLPLTLPCGIICLVMAKKALETETNPLAKPAKIMGIVGIIFGIIDIIVEIGAIILGVVVGFGGLITPILMALGVSSAESFGSSAGDSIANFLFG